MKYSKHSNIKQYYIEDRHADIFYIRLALQEPAIPARILDHTLHKTLKYYQHCSPRTLIYKKIQKPIIYEI